MNGHTYFYVVTALDQKGLESRYSKEIRVKIP
jgi:fibronectin type 3 domain-containing protein